MKVLVATDAWHPQINGVVNTLKALQRHAPALGAEIVFVTPDGFRTFGLPTYPGLRCAVPSRRVIEARIDDIAPDAIHIATEGPIGLMVRSICLRRGLQFTTSFTTRFAEYASARFPVPLSWGYALMRRFHEPAAATMVSTPSLMAELTARGFAPLRIWSRGVDTDLFHPDRATPVDLPRPIFVSVGRVAVEKNLEAFLSLDLPGTKVIIGHGPQEDELRQRYPDVVFLGTLTGEALARQVASSDVFVFPSLTDTFGIVQLEALASGVPVAAFPVTGPRDVIGDAPVGALDYDLRKACLTALTMSREACRRHALGYSWSNSARQFLSNVVPAVATASVPSSSKPVPAAAHSVG